MRRKLQRLYHQKHIRLAVGVVWQSSRLYTSGWLIVLLLQALLPVTLVYFTRSSIDLISAYLNGALVSNDVLILSLLALISVTILHPILANIYEWFVFAQREKVRVSIGIATLEKINSFDLSLFETPQYYDALYRAWVDAPKQPVILVQTLGNIVRNFISLSGMLIIIVSYSPFLVFILMLGSIPTLLVALVFSAKYDSWRKKNTSKEREASYYEWLLTIPQAAAENRLLDLGEHYLERYRQTRLRLLDERVNLEKKRMWAGFIPVLIGIATTGGVMLWMVLRVLQKLATLGDLVAFYQIFSQGQRLMQEMLASAGKLYESVAIIDSLIEFNNLERRLHDDPKQNELPLPLQTGITFNQITFRYAGSERYALDNFSWHVPANKIVALVGANGEGKSTLIKLLCRLYDPDAGQVLWDGIDIRDLPLRDVRRGVTVLFQNPQPYYESVRKNIIVGDLETNHSEVDIETAAGVAGASSFIQRMPHAYATVLGKWFGGEELSGGEWQRLALARAFIRKSPIIVLDEPTSAMDTWSEQDWLWRLKSFAQGHTVIMITHRFTTAMQADKIYVMQDNQIIETGTHNELITKNGYYAAGWQQHTDTESVLKS